MNNYQKHFERELKILEDGLDEGDNLSIKDFIPDIISITEKFSKQGHSGMSGSFYSGALSSAIKRILSFEPLSPLTGEDSEWNDTGVTLNKGEPNGHYQNKRLGSVFKDGKDGKAYYTRGIVWKGEEKHDTFTGKMFGISNRFYIKSFPFKSKTFYIDVIKDYEWEKYPEKEVFDISENNKYVYRLKDKKQLEEVFDYYDKK